MARKKQLPENALVQKRNVMTNIEKKEPEIFDNATMSNWFRKKMNIYEYRILDLYMASINSHDISTKEVAIDLEHVKELTNARLSTDEYNKMMFNITSSCVVSNSKYINLFQYAELKTNKNGEPTQIVLMCTPKAEEYFFNYDKLGYFKYKFKTIQNIGSVYSYLLFNYLEKNRNWYKGKSWEVSVDKLKQIIDCDEKLYDSFKRFNDLILKKSIAELNENHRKVNNISDENYCEYSYKTIKHGRKVIGIEFTVSEFDFSVKIPMSEPIPAPVQNEQMSLFDMFESKYADFFTEHFGDSMAEDFYKEYISDQLTLFSIDAAESKIEIILKRSIERFNAMISKTKISDTDKYFRKIIESECVNAAKMILKAKQPKPEPEPEKITEQDELDLAITFSGNTKRHK